MERRTFVLSALTGIAGISLAPSIAFMPGDKRSLPGNWAWMNGYLRTPGNRWKELFDKMLGAKINGLLVDGSNELYEKIGPLCEQAGIQLHAWRWTINRGQYINEHPDWYAVNRQGQSVVDNPPYVHYYRWLCPSRPEVREEIANDYASLAVIPGMSGVHLDYVRYSDIYLPVGLLPKYNLVQEFEMPEYDYCYCSSCRGQFKTKHGYDPLETEDPSKDLNWHQFRLDLVVDLVRDIVKAVHQKESIITGAVFPTPEMSRNMVRQDWARFNLDAYLPMLYHKFYLQPTDWIGDCVKEIRSEIGSRVPVFAGILNDPAVFTPEVLERTVMQVKEAGGQGIAIFTAGSLREEQLKTLTLTSF